MGDHDEEMCALGELTAAFGEHVPAALRVASDGPKPSTRNRVEESRQSGMLRTPERLNKLQPSGLVLFKVDQTTSRARDMPPGG